MLGSMGVRLSANISDGLFDYDLLVQMLGRWKKQLTAVDGISLLVGNLNAEFFLDGHYNLDGV